MKQILKLILAAGMTVTLGGCAALGGGGDVQIVDTKNDRAATVAGLDYRDFELAASDAIQSMLQSGAVTNPNGGRYILMISRITNDTMQRIDTDQLIKKIRVDLLNSGKVAVTTAVSLTGAEDQANYAVRDGLRGNKEFDQSRVQRSGTLQAPDLSLSGKILQRNLPMGGGKQQIEYYFQLTLTELASGLAIWENETPLIKRGSNKSAAW